MAESLERFTLSVEKDSSDVERCSTVFVAKLNVYRTIAFNFEFALSDPTLLPFPFALSLCINNM